MFRVLFLILACGVSSTIALGQEATSTTFGTEVTIMGSVVCNGACIPDPTDDDHVMVIYAIDGAADIKSEVDRIMKEFYPDRGLDGDAAEILLDQFTARLKYYIAPNSPALQDAKNEAKDHYCMPAVPRAVTGIVSEKDGQKWITAGKIEPAKLKYPDKMLAPDKPFAMPDREPLLLKINDEMTLKMHLDSARQIPDGHAVVHVAVFHGGVPAHGDVDQALLPVGDPGHPGDVRGGHGQQPQYREGSTTPGAGSSLR